MDVNVFISIDMEGVAGIAHGQQVARGSDDYPAGRLLMTQEANAAVAGALAGGATSVVVNDSHGDMRNLLPERMDRRAELLIGSPKLTQGMMQGLDERFTVALFIGYHAMAGTQDAILDHTYSGAVVYDLRVNGESWGEGELNAALAGSYGVPVGLVTGDDKACAQAEKQLPGVRTVVVKHALGRSVARSLHPAEARDAIEAAARQAVAAASDLHPFTMQPPFVLEMDFASTGAAEVAALAPGSERIGSRTLRYTTDDMREVYRARMAWTTLAGTAIGRR